MNDIEPWQEWDCDAIVEDVPTNGYEHFDPTNYKDGPKNGYNEPPWVSGSTNYGETSNTVLEILWSGIKLFSRLFVICVVLVVIVSLFQTIVGV